MSQMPVQRSAAAPDQVEDATVAAESVVADVAKQGTPEWLAAKQHLADRGRSKGGDAAFGDLEKEMQGLKGMSEI